MRQVLGPGALGRPRGIGWRGRFEGGSGWGIHVNPWLIHVNVWQNPLQYCKVISLQQIKINGKKEKCSSVGICLIFTPLLDWDYTFCGRDYKGEGFPGGTRVKNLCANAGDIKDMGSIPGSGRSPAVGNGNPLQYSCLDNPVDSGAWPVTVYGVAKGQTRLSTHRTKMPYPSYHVKATRVYLIYHCW